MFRDWGLGFGVLGFGVWGLGFGVWGLGFGTYEHSVLYQEGDKIRQDQYQEPWDKSST